MLRGRPAPGTEVQMQEPSLQVQSPAFRRVGAGHGVEWWSRAWQLLFQKGAAGVWIAMNLIAFVIGLVLHFVPFVGWIAGQMAVFVFAGGLMLAARKTEQGTVPSVGDLFAGFGPPLGSLVFGAVLVFVGSLVIFGAITMAGASALLAGMLGFASGHPGSLVGLGATSLLLLLVALLLFIPLSLAWWLAPALIVLRQQQPFEALKTSLAAGWANLGAVAVCGLLGIAFAIIASIPLMLGWLVLGPLIALMTYAAYRDLFETA
jgi:uncharacterized membrane protein